MNEKRSAILVPDYVRFSVDPYDIAVAGERSKFCAKRASGNATARKFLVAIGSILRMKLIEPEKRIAQPLLLREAEQCFNTKFAQGCRFW